MGMHEFAIQDFGRERFVGINTKPADEIPRNVPYDLLSEGRSAQGSAQAVLRNGYWPRQGVKQENNQQHPMVGTGPLGDQGFLIIDGKTHIISLTTIQGGSEDICAVTFRNMTIPIDMLKEEYGADCQFLIKPKHFRDMQDEREGRAVRYAPELAVVGVGEPEPHREQTIFTLEDLGMEDLFPKPSPVQATIDALGIVAQESNSVPRAKTYSGRILECYGIECAGVNALALRAFDNQIRDAEDADIFSRKLLGGGDELFTHQLTLETYNDVKAGLIAIINGREGLSVTDIAKTVLAGLGSFRNGSEFLVGMTNDAGVDTITAMVNVPKKRKKR